MTDTDTSHLSNSTPDYPEGLLSAFHPRPSPGFYKRIQRTPWQRSYQHHLLLKWVISLTIMVAVVIVGFTISPPLQAIARQLFSFFIPDTQDTLEVSIEGITPLELFQYASAENFSLSIEQAEQQAEFSIRQPESLLPGLELIGTRYEPDLHVVILLYQGAGYNLFLSQRSLSDQPEYFSIGASAQVEIVQIGTFQGEYVAGGWVAVPGTQLSDIDSQSTIQAVWDPTLPQFTLRWQSEGFAFELRSSGTNSPQKADLISLAADIR